MRFPKSKNRLRSILPDGGILVGGGLITGTGTSEVQVPLLIGLDANGQPTGFRVTEAPTSSARYVQRIMVQGTSYVVEIDYSLRRLSAAGAFDPTFGNGGSVGIGFDAVALTDAGFVVATSQLNKLTTYRLTPDGKQVSNSAAMLNTNAWQLTTVLSRANDATLVGQAMTGTPGSYDLVVGRILANNTPDTTSYGPNGFVTIDGGQTDEPSAAFELPDGGLFIGGIEHAAAVIRVNADGTLARIYDLDSGSVAAVTMWNGMITIAGNMRSSGVVACLPP
jgi:hypothetical protein